LKTKIFLRPEIQTLEKSYRTNLINGLSGFQSANLIGTINSVGITNLAIFNSVMHIGADPALMGFIARPSAELHTLKNIQETGAFTINAVHESIFKNAHQTSARYANGVSEFDVCGLGHEFSKNCTAPYVLESRIKIGLTLAEEYTLKSNGCHLVVGEIIEIILEESLLTIDGNVDHKKAKSITVLGLDEYHSTQVLGKLAYAKVSES